VNLRHWICHLLSLLRIHSPECENCNPGGRYRGKEMRKRHRPLGAARTKALSPFSKILRFVRSAPLESSSCGTVCADWRKTVTAAQTSPLGNFRRTSVGSKPFTRPQRNSHDLEQGMRRRIGPEEESRLQPLGCSIGSQQCRQSESSDNCGIVGSPSPHSMSKGW
jgi:hypothetical protein